MLNVLFPLREVPILKRGAVEENRCFFPLMCVFFQGSGDTIG